MENQINFTPCKIIKMGVLALHHGIICLVAIFSFSDRLAWSQEPITDQVTVTVSKGRLLGIHSGEGIARISLAAGENIVAMKAKGITGFVQTSERLLGYSGKLQRWSKRRLEVSEVVQNVYVTPRLVLVVGEQHIYGFQSEVGQWRIKPLRSGETLTQAIVKDHVAVVISNHQAFGFSAFTGGFFIKDLPLTYEEINSDANDNIIILKLSDRQLVFRSRLAVWTELR